jgi:hypothetical protein
MKKYLLNKRNILFIGLILIALGTIRFNHKVKKEFRYKIVGYVHYGSETKQAIWYVDSIIKGENFVCYHNSDGTEVVIPRPYVIIDYKHDFVIKK